MPRGRKATAATAEQKPKRATRTTRKKLDTTSTTVAIPIIPLAVLPPATEEQQQIIEDIKTHNVVCDSVAGSGKTTTSLYIAKTYEDKSILLLTYNSKLRLETRSKAEKLNLNNIEVHTFHSYCYKYYSKCKDDNDMNKIIKYDTDVTQPPTFDIVIIDECQDMTEMYYEIVCKITRDIQNKFKILIIGDKKQSIYEFKGADERYIMNAEQLFHFNGKKWKQDSLHISFRLPKEIGDIVNFVTGEERIRTVKEQGCKPRYVICNSFMESFRGDRKDMTTFEEYRYYISEGYKPGDIMIISPTIKKSKPINNLLAEITKHDKTVKIYKATSDTQKINEDAIKDKLLVVSYHQSKGLERKVSIVYGIDMSYFDVFGRNKVESICPNEMYVALTRSKERLSVIHNETSKYCDFIDSTRLEDYAEVINYKSNNGRRNKLLRDITIKDLVQYLPYTLIDMNLKNIKKKEVIIKEENEDMIERINERLKVYEDTEEVSQQLKIINNKKLPDVGVTEYTISIVNELYNYIKNKNRIIDKDVLRFKVHEMDGIIEDVREDIYNTIEKKELTIEDITKIGIVRKIGTDVYKLNKIAEYNWIREDEALKACRRIAYIDKNTMNNVDRVKKVLLSDALKEVKKEHDTKLYVNLSSTVDKESTNKMIKYINNDISVEDILEGAINTLFMYNKKSIVYDILNNKQYEIEVTNKDAYHTLCMLIANKFIGYKELTKDDFINTKLEILNKYYDYKK